MSTRLLQQLLAAFAIVVLCAASVVVADQPYLNLARQLAGRYVGVAGPGNNLKIVVQPGRPVQEEQRLTVTVMGKYNGSNVRFDGLLALQPQGQTVRLIWSGRRSDCQVDIHPEGDGFEGVTLPGNCQTAFQNPTPGKWQFQTEPGSFRLRNVETGETLRFRKTKALGK